MIVTSQWKGFPEFEWLWKFQYGSFRKKQTQHNMFLFQLNSSEQKQTQNANNVLSSSPCLTHKATLNSPWWPGFAEVSRSYWAPRVRVFCMSLVTQGACMGKPWVELENTWRPCRGPVGVFSLDLWQLDVVLNSINWGSSIPFFGGWVGSRYENHWKSMEIRKQI